MCCTHQSTGAGDYEDLLSSVSLPPAQILANFVHKIIISARKKQIYPMIFPVIMIHAHSYICSPYLVSLRAIISWKINNMCRAQRYPCLQASYRKTSIFVFIHSSTQQVITNGPIWHMVLKCYPNTVSLLLCIYICIYICVYIYIHIYISVKNCLPLYLQGWHLNTVTINQIDRFCCQCLYLSSVSKTVSFIRKSFNCQQHV